MSLSVVAGAQSLVQLGVSLGDVAVVLRVGKILGNWLRVAENDDEFFKSILETSNALLRRHGLVDPIRMMNMWSSINFIYQGRPISKHRRVSPIVPQEMTMFSWVMVAIVTALDLCLPSSALTALLVKVFVKVLDGDKDTEESISLQLPTNIRSWRSVGCVREMVTVVSSAFKKCRSELVNTKVVPQLNVVECREMEEMLVWLLAGESDTMVVVSATNYAVANAIREAGVHITTGSARQHEKEPMVVYAHSPGADDQMQGLLFFTDNMHNGRMRKSQIIAYPRANPQSMIEAMTVPREIKNRMALFWHLGAKAGSCVSLKAEALLPFSPDSDIWYTLEEWDAVASGFGVHVDLIASHGFPTRTESSFMAVEELIKGVPDDQISWLHTYTSAGYLQRMEFVENSIVEYPPLLAQYQALIFGFYYRLFETMISFHTTKQSSYFRGSWGAGSTHFLNVCTQFAHEIQHKGRVSRSHILHMLSTMFDGRDTTYSPENSRSGLLGILGNVSVLSHCMLHTSDLPSELARFHVVDLSFVDLLPESGGELYSSYNTSIKLSATGPSCGIPLKNIEPQSDRGQWSIHPRMGIFSNEDEKGVVMAVRRSGVLIDYFSPLAADLAFLSSCYQAPQHEHEEDYVDAGTITGIEVREDHWDKAILPRPVPDPHVESVVLAVHSRGCPAMRYAAAGFFMGAREEVAIATNDVNVAFDRVGAQGTGVIIT